MRPITKQVFCSKDISETYECLTDYHSEMLKTYQYSVCKAMYKEDIEDLNLWISQAKIAEQCGTITMTLDGSSNYTDVIRRNLECAVDYLTDPPQIKKKPIVWDDMPDLLSDDQLSEYFGWAISTIQSKRSRGELPKIDGMALTPKKLLMDMFDALSVDCGRVNDDHNAVKNKVNSFKRK